MKDIADDVQVRRGGGGGKRGRCAVEVWQAVKVIEITDLLQVAPTLFTSLNRDCRS